ncbi:hypothetical protein [Streptomyces nitrosporeus]|uniref:hypothetical protein n=1 Tax=Streptomyces nitrosporeus TaxID=28894 RepID=UPI0033203D9F
MDTVQQQMLDSYRAARHGDVPPPPPGRHEAEVLRSLLGRLLAPGPRGPGPPPRG